MNEHLRRAREALEAGAADVRSLTDHSVPRLRRRLHETVEEVLEHLEADASEPDPEDVMSKLDRQAQDIADDLRRAERLMRKRTGQD